LGGGSRALGLRGALAAALGAGLALGLELQPRTINENAIGYDQLEQRRI
jgi:hypothetical protein